MNPSAKFAGAAEEKGKTRVVIVGGGFAGLHAAKALGNRQPFEVTLIDRLNHYTFQPLLYQVATAALSAQDSPNSVAISVSAAMAFFSSAASL